MNNNNNKNGLFRNSLFYIVIFLGIMGALYYVFGNHSNSQSQQIQSSQFVTELKKGNVKSFTMQPSGSTYKVTGVYKKAQKSKETSGLVGFPSSESKVDHFSTNVLTNDSSVAQIKKYAEKNNVKYGAKEEESSSIWIQLLIYVVPLFFFIIFFYMMMGQAGQGGGNGRVMNFGKAKAKPVDKKNNKVRFSDVAGAEEEKQELVEVVEFLRDPHKFLALGAKIPSGVLLEGPPGTGKTLLAKAVAGEAGVPFFSISGSDFVEMFVGVGASRVRDLFENAKKNAPSIIFIDEIDAVGRRRGNGMGGGHDEREQTLNQLLVEMDGFEGDEGVIVMAATNRSDVLDPALLRPGRFDRKILVGRPDVKGREAILKVHAKNKPLAKDVDLKIIAKQTPGFVGADLANLLNEAALLAARRNKKEIDASDVDEAEDRVIAGPAKRDRVISKKERETVAFHEAGHTIVGLVLNDARVVHKVTIVPRGRAGGYAIMLPKEDQMLLSKKDLKEQIAGLMGGRAAEELIFNQQSSGASNDFQQATQLARSMVTEYGMSEKLGPVQYEGQSGMFAGDYVPGQQPFSIDTSNAIDSEVKALCEEGMATAKKIIEEHKEQHRIIAEALLEYETLDERQILSLYKTGKMPAQAEDEFPSEKAATFEEAKEALIRKDAVKQEESHRDELEDEFPSEENLKQADSEDSDKSENETNEPKNDDDKDE
ncbi:ATP-dependent zinc metalloprotease FtsH [Ligilactobacillus ruminis]|uniref:ATP-dependent zinc metalloprotease FtsH n=1 Tax=Ligilactobacillus ruminis TaxID=1623 RepID=A0A6A8HCP3_9LACO|nr:ATP-dependent zinc metalloprotease FtsH [Ligilactobacillus ruminis]MBD8998793.1 ATP-dependent metallopeptidase FtsH/Yme1/Tma family protein [Ligilactobacillus ruminis]MBS7037093.1 ATP-dependent zinc metalloprotease FtsH [Ligilactobacillus ruminis]MSA21110.1 ATP-dependent zinc metalloprotease FtsH [Ligilactobacillus ruminis]MSA23157.1 ATP-dependent zinc metalloprotease FtsH [Ligilactobacillus ruminis]MSA24941.1 ATP-dependent zinc metalloprotease FtsH [Ligilactobacillus ruminis]